MANQQTSNRVGDAADQYAKALLAEYELKSPLFRDAIVGVPRSVIVGLLSLSFTQGTIYGAERLAKNITETA